MNIWTLDICFQNQSVFWTIWTLSWLKSTSVNIWSGYAAHSTTLGTSWLNRCKPPRWWSLFEEKKTKQNLILMMAVNLAKISEIMSVGKHSFPLINIEIPGDSDPWGQADKAVQRATCCQGDGSVHLLLADPYHHYRRHQTDKMSCFCSDCVISLSS